MGVVQRAERQHAERRVRAGGAARRRGDDDAGSLPVVLVRLYHAEGCHLCARARAQVAAVQEVEPFDLEEVDIGGDAKLEAEYREWLPVVEIDGERAFTYFVHPDALRRKVAQARAREQTL